MQKDENKFPVIMKILDVSLHRAPRYVGAEVQVAFYVKAYQQAARVCTVKKLFETLVADENEEVNTVAVLRALQDCIEQFNCSAWPDKNTLKYGRCLQVRTNGSFGDTGTTDIEDNTRDRDIARIGFGLGIPYGIIGSNLEINTGDYTAVSAGVGYFTGGPACAGGGRLYFAPRDSTFRIRLSAFYGVVALREVHGLAYYDVKTKYRNIDGAAEGLGFQYNFKTTSIDFDVFHLDYSLPSGYEKKNEDITISLGYGIHF
jgi:hypothetical protein